MRKPSKPLQYINNVMLLLHLSFDSNTNISHLNWEINWTVNINNSIYLDLILLKNDFFFFPRQMLFLRYRRKNFPRSWHLKILISCEHRHGYRNFQEKKSRHSSVNQQPLNMAEITPTHSTDRNLKCKQKSL